MNSSDVVNINQNFPNSQKAYKKILSLPSSVLMDEEQINYIISVLNKY